MTAVKLSSNFLNRSFLSAVPTTSSDKLIWKSMFRKKSYLCLLLSVNKEDFTSHLLLNASGLLDHITVLSRSDNPIEISQQHQRFKTIYESKELNHIHHSHLSVETWDRHVMNLEWDVSFIRSYDDINISFKPAFLTSRSIVRKS